LRSLARDAHSAALAVTASAVPIATLPYWILSYAKEQLCRELRNEAPVFF